MKTIMITAPSSNTGKTLITLGLIRALKNRGLDISAFKTGPDFIDTRYLGLASGKRAGNLDMYMMGEEGLEVGLSMNRGEYALIEGAMGYFDGIYNTFENSSYHISKKLNINALLIYTPKGEMFSAIPKIKGMVDFSDSRIKGIILNKVRKDIYLLLKEKIEEYIGIRVLGYVEEDKDLEIQSWYLGLVQSMENQYAENIIDKLSKIMEKTVHLEEIIHLMNDLDISKYEYPRKRNIKVAIAYDKAFSFYYNENLRLLENSCQVEYFSPLKDKEIPKCDLLYIGGGYPELYKKELSQNQTMINSIRKMVELGGYIYGEAGGFMYLVENIENAPMVGIFKGKAYMTDRLQRFGYTNIQLMEDTILGRRGEELVGQEFHRSIIEIEDRPLYYISKPKTNRNWQCGYSYKNVLGAYPHINFLGNMEAFNYLLDRIENKR
ncbi:cobyrinate a,c-diamide synthase [Clostridium sp. Cult1]|uniref:cobyrinate a,c-diamide synthase n=1 Tax=Clostridium sp. Cult1 TaxID=2079002 RepID=UPI001F01BDF6|nr:cobyrinate a,c-diamide synthase [Clostridium sp. Cult1]MCF6462890.1 cobyrinate a,c-diamide synthase [Clostridium sp. Cult1]